MLSGKDAAGRYCLIDMQVPRAPGCRRARDVLLFGDRHEASQMTEFHLLQVCPTA
jgi:hypothetical protein